MSEERDFGEEFEELVDSEDQDPLDVHVEVEPIDPWDDILDDGKLKHRTLREAVEEARIRKAKRNDKNDDKEGIRNG